MHVAVDLDDVCLDFVTGLCRSLKKEYGVELGEGDIQDFNLGPVLNPIIGRNWWTWLRERDWLWPNFDAVDGAIGGVDTLRRQGYYVELITSKPEWAEYAVWRWLGKWRFPFKRVTIVGPKQRKSDYTDADILVDDKVENCEEFVDSATWRHAILFDRSHNRRYSIESGRIVRAADWAGVLSAVATITEEQEND